MAGVRPARPGRQLRALRGRGAGLTDADQHRRSDAARRVRGLGDLGPCGRNNYLDFGWDTFSEDKKLQKRAIELNQGRAAQMGILALMVHEQLGVSILP